MPPLDEVHAQWAGDPTVVLTRTVRPGCAEAFQAWAEAFTQVVAAQPGVASCKVHPPVDGAQEAWVFVSTFASREALRAWIDSEVRAKWLAEAEPMVEETGRMRVISGLEALLGLPDAGLRPPPVWKLALVTQAGLYPTVIVHWLFVAPLLAPLPFLARAFCSAAVTVVLMTWVVMPVVTRLARPWLTR